MAYVNDINDTVKQAVWLRNLETDMKLIFPYMENPKVTDIAIGNGGELIVEGIGMKKNFTGIIFDSATTTRIIKAAAAVIGVNIDEKNPIVEGSINLSNYTIRFEGILPPRSATTPMIFIRRPSSEIYSLEDYLREKRITQQQYDLLIKHIKNQSNIVLSGATGSGKTTMLNACLWKMVEFTPDDRFYIVEDAGEIQCKARDIVPIWAEGEDTTRMIRVAMRCKVSRIIFGELRYGSTTNEVLKAWNSGHKGGLTTIHSDSAILAIEKLRMYLREVLVGELPDVAQSIQLVIHMIPTKNGPIVNEIFETHQATQIIQSSSGQTTSNFIQELEVNGLI